jgi:hypothetical protein
MEVVMAKAPYKLPNVFVGCPYGGRFRFAEFKKALDRIPFRFHYADTHLTTKHLLGILRTYISTADFCIFDLSTWNANVALELGIAEGLDVQYYILINKKMSSGVPADIQGIQRIEYSNAASLDSADGLIQKLANYLVKEHTHPRKIWEELEGTANREGRYLLALGMLAHLRDNKRLRLSDAAALSRGSYIRKPAQIEVYEILKRLDLVSGEIESKNGGYLIKNLFKDPIRPR